MQIPWTNDDPRREGRNLPVYSLQVSRNAFPSDVHQIPRGTGGERVYLCSDTEQSRAWIVANPVKFANGAKWTQSFIGEIPDAHGPEFAGGGARTRWADPVERVRIWTVERKICDDVSQEMTRSHLLYVVLQCKNRSILLRPKESAKVKEHVPLRFIAREPRV